MKKLYQGADWKRLQRKRQLAELKRRRKKRSRPRKQRTRRPVVGEVRVVAPTVLSVGVAPSDFNAFIGEIRQARKERRFVDLDLSPVETLRIDGIVTLLATVRETRYVRGNYPLDKDAAAMLFSSGFFDLIDGSGGSGLQQSKGKIYKRISKKVHGEAADELIESVAQALPELSLSTKKAVYRALVELMANTHEHAAVTGSGGTTWYLAAWVNKNERKAAFAFVDTGIGILESVPIKRLRAAARALGLSTNSSLLREILLGKVESRTGLPYRGKGLPAINQAAQRGHLQNLVLAANDVFANVSESRYEDVQPSFSGTLVAWEVSA